jgi:hypothetical protein
VYVGQPEPGSEWERQLLRYQVPPAGSRRRFAAADTAATELGVERAEPLAVQFAEGQRSEKVPVEQLVNRRLRPRVAPLVDLTQQPGTRLLRLGCGSRPCGDDLGPDRPHSLIVCGMAKIAGTASRLEGRALVVPVPWVVRFADGARLDVGGHGSALHVRDLEATGGG